MEQHQARREQGCSAARGARLSHEQTRDSGPTAQRAWLLRHLITHCQNGPVDVHHFTYCAYTCSFPRPGGLFTLTPERARLLLYFTSTAATRVPNETREVGKLVTRECQKISRSKQVEQTRGEINSRGSLRVASSICVSLLHLSFTSPFIPLMDERKPSGTL